MSRTEESVELLRISGIRFVIICVSGITPVMYTLEIEGLLYAGTHQFLGSEVMMLVAATTLSVKNPRTNAMMHLFVNLMSTP